MIPADQLPLITAAVDGELSPTEASAFRRLLDSSPEARALYIKLKADSVRVRNLTPVAPPVDLKAKVMARIASATPAPRPKLTARPTQPAQVSQPVSPAQPATLPFRERVAKWAPVAVAASVLLCVTVGSFAFFSQTGSSANRPKPDSENGDGKWANWLPADHDRTPSAPIGLPDPGAVVRDGSPVPPVPPPRPVVPEAVAIAPEPRPATSQFHASPIRPPLPPFDLVQVRIPFLRPVADITREDVRQELIDELGHDPAYRIDLFVRDTGRGVGVFQNAAKASGLTMFSDATTMDKLKKRQVTAVVIYTDSLTGPELAALFAKLSLEDAKFSPRVYDSLHATPVVGADERELKAVLGTDPGLFKRPAVGPTGTGQGTDKGDKTDRGDPKPISAGTIDSVVKTVSAPPAKPGEKPAVLLTWQTIQPGIPRTNPAMSKELKSFLDKRGDRKPNAVPAIIIIRQLAG
ncbi:MAG: hypothetical protein L0241_23900 [Planctomycetia bacterium]|nr:hypothetical protein [Planctomycetia bacterium]